jgi:hypothetical protein
MRIKKRIKRVMLVFLFGLLIGLSLSHNSNPEFNLDDNSMSVVNSLRAGNQKYPNNFDENFHRILRKGFPDFKKRVEFEKSQLKFYNSARSKLYRAPLGVHYRNKLLSPHEQDAINYFTGQVFYRSQQDFRTKPNIFDTRESFLLKMHNESNRNRFLKSLQESCSLSWSSCNLSNISLSMDPEK